jgi:hypothetical protein
VKKTTETVLLRTFIGNTLAGQTTTKRTVHTSATKSTFLYVEGGLRRRYRNADGMLVSDRYLPAPAKTREYA